MHQANYEDAMLIGRILDMRPDEVWPIIEGMTYAYFSELKIAVLNSPPRHTPRPTDLTSGLETFGL